MPKILYVASKVKLHINLFHIPFFIRLQNQGSEVHVAAFNDYENKNECRIAGCDRFYDLPFRRIPFHPANLKAYMELRRIIRQNDYDIIHCHTPVGAAIGRLASRQARKHGVKVIYTAHGLHFYKGAPLMNRIMYYPAERLLARITDVIITINGEDTNSALKFKCPSVVKMNGVGIAVGNYASVDLKNTERIRKSLNIPLHDPILFFAGELSYRKHQDFLIKVIGNISKCENVHLILAGEGTYFNRYKKMADASGYGARIHFLGFRDDVCDLIKTSDICVSASRQEGLPVNIMEAMASGLPVVCFDIRGNSDLIIDGKGGFLVPVNDLETFSQKVSHLLNNEKLRTEMGEFNRKIIVEYDREKVVNDMMELYDGLLNE